MHQAEEEDTLGKEMVRMEIKPEVERARIAVVRVVLEPPVHGNSKDGGFVQIIAFPNKLKVFRGCARLRRSAIKVHFALWRSHTLIHMHAQPPIVTNGES